MDGETRTTIPEIIEESKAQVESVALRTVLRKDVYERLRKVAQEYSTGRGHWDFGIAIQVLLDDRDNNLADMQVGKIDAILSIVSEIGSKEEEKPEQKEVELLGGMKEKI